MRDFILWKSKGAYLFLLILLSTAPSYSQIKSKGIPFIRNYSPEEYNASSQNWSIAQDYMGMMYFANNNGLLAFDGTYWRTYAVSDNIGIRTVKSDTSGRLYVGGPNNAGYFYPNQSGKFLYYSLFENIKTQVPNIGNIWNVFLLSDKIVLHSDNGLYTFAKDNLVAYNSKQTHARAFQVNDKVFIANAEKGLMVLDGDLFLPVIEDGDFSDLQITSLIPLDNNKYLLATLRNGLYILENQILKKWKTPVDDFLKENQVFCGKNLVIKNSGSALLTEHYYAFGTIQNGLLIIDSKGNPVQHLNKDKGLQNNTILDIFLDVSGNLWLALDNGIDFIELSSPFSQFSDEIGFQGTTYALEFLNDKIYFGTNQGVYVKDNALMDNTLSYQAKASIIPNTEGQVWNFFQVGNQLLCAHHEGLLSIRGMQARKIIAAPGVWGLTEYINNTILLGHYYGISFNEKPEIEQAVMQNLLLKATELRNFDQSARIIEIDEKDSTLWIAHGYNGVYHIVPNIKTASVTKQVLYTTKHGLPSDQLNSIFRVRDELIIGTIQGVYKMAEDKDTIVPHDFYTKYLGNNTHIRNMVEDRYGNIWVSAGENIGVMIRQPDGTFQYQEDQFMRIKNILVGGFELMKVADKDNVYFGTHNGLIHYSPRIKKNVHESFNVLIRRANFNGIKTITAYSGYPTKGKEIDQLTSIEIPYTNNSAQFVYSATYFEANENNRYQLKLEGFDKEWSEWTEKTEKEYTNLREGTYIFRVKAMNIYHTISEEASYRFVILPPWHRSTIAYIAYALLLIALIAQLSVIIYKRFKNQRIRLIHEKTKEVQAQQVAFMHQNDIKEKEIARLRNEKLEAENAQKNTELASYAMLINQKNKMLSFLQLKLTHVAGKVNESAKKQLEELIKQIQLENRSNNDTEKFEKYFNEVHNNFLTRLIKKHSNLSPKEIKMCTYLRMNLSTKEIASLLNITTGGVEKGRYRLRKELNLPKEDNLLEYILKF